MGCHVREVLSNIWRDDAAQDIAEYGVMIAAMLVLVLAAVRVIGYQAHNIFAEVARLLQ
jgi:Flp pilus assembly pilin Flp